VSTVDQAPSAINSPSRAQRALWPLYFVRGAFALVWAAAFTASGDQLTAATVTLLIVYPAIDVISSAYDASTHRTTGPATMQWVNAAISTVALIGLAVASTQNTAWVLHVFGAWATVSGLMQLIVALRRRRQLGTQWASLISGGLSTVVGITFNVMAGSHHAQLSMLSGYAFLGGLFFLVDGFLLRRRHRIHPGQHV
jgi:hypothetical protein